MEIEIFTLCDHAQDFNGKLVIVGTFDSISSSTYPFTHAACSLAGRLRFSEKESGVHEFRIKLIDEEGVELYPAIEGNIDVSKSVANYSTINFAINLGNLEFKKPGKYAIELYIDNEWQKGLPINVIKQ
jgi:hypothetical protein